MEIRLVEINANSNATESVTKVKDCIFFFLPPEEYNRIETEKLTGGYGNIITTLKYSSRDPALINHILKQLISHLVPSDKYEIGETLENRLSSKGVLFLRISKRSLSQNKIILTKQSDSIRVQFRISNNHHKLDPLKNIHELKDFLSGLGLIER
ncbi:MAG: hypothetical protein JW776_02705 [Candidatus Lokiarchaeota archaeon]|nr:hypothetical protein [Candidatus Lokiarchaeota archaeon]